MTLQATPHSEAAKLALEIYRQTLEQIRGDRLIQSQVWMEGDTLNIDDIALPLPEYKRVFVCGAGKASVAMARGLSEVIGDELDGGLVVTKHGHQELLAKIEVLEAGHPVPDEASLAAGRAMLDFAAQTTEDDLVLFCLSGGASALMEAPVEGVSLSQLQAKNRELLASGADISTINAARARLSKIKAGGLGRAFRRPTVVCLVMSDVVGNDLQVIGSGPFFGSEGVAHRFIGDSRILRHIAVKAAEGLGLQRIRTATIKGEAKDFYPRCEKKLRGGLLRKEPDCLIATGEPTVKIHGQGLGGRAQEMALVAAQRIAGAPNLAVLCAGSDGTDGPTDAAGALVDGSTLSRAQEKGQSAEKALAENDSYPFHEAAGSLIKTGPTGSNLNDILIVVRA